MEPSGSRWDVGSRANLVAGLTVAAYLVPQVMAYSTVAGLPPTAGLWAALPALVSYAVLGTSRLLSLGPESSVALMTAAVVAPLASGDPQRYAATAAALALAVGAVLLLASVLKLSFVADLLSRPVLVGYLTGIALLMIVGQLPSLLAVPVSGDTVLAEIGSAIGQLPNADAASIAAGLAVIGLVWLLARWPRLPGPLLAIVAVGLVSWFLGGSLPSIGEIPRGLPTPELPWVPAAQVPPLLLGALGVSLVAFADSTLTARAFRTPGEAPIDHAAELRALAVANAGAGLLQGMAVSSSGSRTALARQAGATSQAYSLVVAAALASVLLLIGPLLSGLPRAALAGLVVYAAVQLIDTREWRRLARFRSSELGLAAFTVVAVLALGVLYGVLAAVGLSVLEMLGRVARPHAAALGFVPGLAGMHDIDDFEGTTEEPGLLVFRYDSPLFFANADDFHRRALELARQRQPGLRWLALNCEAIVEVDSTAVAVLQELQRELAAQGVRLVLVRAKRELLDLLRTTALIDQIGEEHVYPTLPTLIEEFRSQRGGRNPSEGSDS